MTISPGSTLAGLNQYLQSNSIDSHDLSVPQGTVKVVPAWGGRIEFMGAGETNALWTQPDFDETGTWGWNKGGCRSWFSPEGGEKGIYFSSDWKSWECPSAMDPGNYQVVEKTPTRIVMENEFKATSNDGTEYHLVMGRDISVGDMPDAIADGVVCLPIRFAHSYKNLSNRTVEREVDLWHLVQIIPSGTIVVPLKDGEGDAYRNYFEPVPDERVAEQGGCLSLRIDGAKRYKLGVNQKRAAGMIAYIRFDGDQATMFIKRFEIDPDGVYADKPEIDQVTNGDPIQMYNHLTGGPAGFGEIECHAPATILEPQKGQVFPIEIYLLEGPRDAVLESGGNLLNTDMSAVKLW